MDDGFSNALNALYTMGDTKLTELISHLSHKDTTWVSAQTRWSILNAGRDIISLHATFMSDLNYPDKRMKYIELVRNITNPGLINQDDTSSVINDTNEELPPRYERVEGIPERPSFSNRSGLDDALKKIEDFNIIKIECLVEMLFIQHLMETEINIKEASPENPYEVIDVLRKDLNMDKINDFAIIVEHAVYFTPDKEGDWIKHLDYTYDMDDQKFGRLILTMTNENTTWMNSLVRSKLRRGGGDREKYAQTMKKFLYLNKEGQQEYIRLVNEMRN